MPVIWQKRENYNKVITVKLVIPSGCNAHCVFCYMHDPKMCMQYDRMAFLDNMIPSLEHILREIGDQNQVSLDITGNEPTYDVDLLREVLQKLRDFEISKKVSRVTMTTNGLNLLQAVPDLAGVVNYVNISVHDFRHPERFDRFRVFFLEGVLDTSENTKGIEYVIADDGRLYADFYKRTRIEDYPFQIGEIYDRIEGAE